VLAGLHLYWSVGGRWPGHDEESLARMVVGGPPGMRMPGMTACLVVSVLLVAGAVVVLGAAGVLPLPIALMRPAAYVLIGVFLLRGVGGLFDGLFRPATHGSSYARLNLMLYSPLCVTLGVIAWLCTRAP